MKKVAIMLLALVLVSGTAFAAGSQTGQGAFSLDLSGNFASEPDSDFDWTFGPEFGVNADLSRLGVDIGTKSFELQARASMSYYNFDGSVNNVDLEYRRIPFFAGGRILFPVSPQAKLYGQLGLEVSFDKVDHVGGSESDTNLGLVPGVGIIFPVSNQLYLGLNLNMHLISDTYFTLGGTVGFNLP